MVTQSRPIPVIVTRPAEQGARFATGLRDSFRQRVEVIESPLLRPEYLQPALPSRAWTAVIFTSATAVFALNKLGAAATDVPRLAYCVGDRTAEAAAAAGFQTWSAKGDADALFRLIQDRGEPGPLLHLRGRDVTKDLVNILSSAGIETHQAIIYAEVEHPMTPRARAVLATGCPVILPVFSPRSAQILSAELVKSGALSPIFLVAISQNARDAFSRQPLRGVIIAEQPDGPAMLRAVGNALIAAEAA